MSAVIRPVQIDSGRAGIRFCLRPHWHLVLLTASCTLLFLGSARADRGRPTIQGTTLVADSGHALLRGCAWSVDLDNPALPPRQSITDLKTHGINALHLYAEAYNAAAPYPAGSRSSFVDTLVDWTGQDGLYLIITIGNGYPGPHYNEQFAEDFWAFYAPRYASRTHVIYEIYNEPFFGSSPTGMFSSPSSSDVLTLEQKIYVLIRKNAPTTPVLLFSYALFRTQAGLLNTDPTHLGDLKWADANIKDPNQPTVSIWKNAAVALHGYAGVSATSGILGQVLALGYPCMVTEFLDSGHQDIAETEAFENQKVSWLTFLQPPSILDDSQFKTPLDQNGIVWVADYGTWPATSSPPAPGTQIGLKAFANGKWVSTGASPTTDPLVASKTAISGPTEKYLVSLVANSGYYIALKSQSALTFADADATSFYVIPSRNYASSAKIEWMNLPNGNIALKTSSNNKFVSLDPSNPPKLIANQTKVPSTAQFVFSKTP
jgi:hypothetical protein